MLKKLLSVWIGVGCCLSALADDTYRFETLAGWASPIVGADGIGDGARFLGPQGPAMDTAGNLYVADGPGHTIRKITPLGVVTTLAGKAGEPGDADGLGPQARFTFPRAVALDGEGNVYVADNISIRKITPAGMVSTFAGSKDEYGMSDGPATVARFRQPNALAFDQDGKLWVADNINRLVRWVSPSGYVTSVAGYPGASGFVNGTGEDARFSYMAGLAVDSTGDILVTDNNVIRRITPGGVVTTYAGTGEVGHEDGDIASAMFFSPAGLTFDSAGNLYVADTNNQLIRRISSGGVVSTLAGQVLTAGSADGTAFEARFNAPTGVVWDQRHGVLVCDYGNETIRRIREEGEVITLAGSAKAGYAGGARLEARFNGLTGIARKTDGTLLVADTLNQVIRAIAPDGSVSDFAGGAGQAGYANEMGVAARFNQPQGVALDAAGNLYVADTVNRRIRKITSDGTVSTFAGSGEDGVADGQGEEAQFRGPIAIASDANGTLYVVDGTSRVCTVSPSGTVTTVYEGNAMVTPLAITADANGVIYVGAIRALYQISSPGNISYLAGINGESGSADGVGLDARFIHIRGMSWGKDGQLLVLDDNRLRKVSLAGVVLTLATNQTGSPEGAPPGVTGITVDSVGNLYVADTKNGCVLLGAINPEYPSAFDATSYLERNADVQAVLGGDRNAAWNHYLDYGAAEGRTFDERFRAAEYLLLNGDLQAAFGSDQAMAALHWFTYGIGENRRGRMPALFSVENYLAFNADVNAVLAPLPAAEKRVAAWNHYLDYGLFEGRTDSDFHPQAYLAEYPNLAAALGGDLQAAALHWYEIGRPEGWRIPRYFDVATYLARNADVRAAYKRDLYGAWTHYYDWGVVEGRTFDEEFRAEEYLDLYADLQAAFGLDVRAALLHWLYYGKDEGRQGRY